MMSFLQTSAAPALIQAGAKAHWMRLNERRFIMLFTGFCPSAVADPALVRQAFTTAKGSVAGIWPFDIENWPGRLICSF